MTKLVNGIRVECSEAEVSKTLADWADMSKIPELVAVKSIEERLSELEAEVVRLGKIVNKV